MRKLPRDLEELIGRYRAASKAALAQRDRADKPQVTSWHYTSMEGMRGILRSDTFWLHSIYDMNDDAELVYGFGLARKLIGARILDAISRGDDATGALLYVPSRADWLQKVRERFDFYSISFGSKDDDRQWEIYGDNRRGAALGVSPPAFANSAERNSVPQERVFVGKVSYGPEPCTTWHNADIVRAIDVLDEALVRGLLLTEQRRDRFNRALEVEMSTGLVLNSIVTKDESWAHEQELRIVAINDLKARKLEVLPRTDARTGARRDYVVVPAHLRKPGMLAEITLGADAPADAENETKLILRDIGLTGVPVTRAARK